VVRSTNPALTKAERMRFEMATHEIGASRPLVTLEFARATGLVRYFTGRPCKYGHFSERLTSNKTCMECACKIQHGVYRRYRNKIVARTKVYRQANKEAIAKKDAAYQRLNRDRLCQYYSERYMEKRLEIAAKVKAYKASRPGFSTEVGKAYLARKIRAMPPWADRNEIRKIYAEAAAMTAQTGIQYSVDHIYPLKGRNSCGLHVPWNLQIITMIDNCRKATKMPNDWAELERWAA
jgi:hypothetical protein